MTLDSSHEIFSFMRYFINNFTMFFDCEKNKNKKKNVFTGSLYVATIQFYCPEELFYVELELVRLNFQSHLIIDFLDLNNPTIQTVN